MGSNEEDVIVLSTNDEDFDFDDERSDSRRQSGMSGDAGSVNSSLRNTSDDLTGYFDGNKGGAVNQGENSLMDTSNANNSELRHAQQMMEDLGTGGSNVEPMDTAAVDSHSEGRKGDKSGSFDKQLDEKLDESISEIQSKDREGNHESVDVIEGGEQEEGEGDDHDEGDGESAGEDSGEESEDSSNDSADESASSSEESGERSVSSKSSGKRKRPITGSSDSDRTRAKIPKTAKSRSNERERERRRSRSKERKCAEEDRLKFFFEDARFFMIKSANLENVSLSKARGVWATTSRNEKCLNKAFQTSKNVILVFSVERSQRFQGFARIAAEASHAHSPVNWVLPVCFSARNLGGIFKLHWINRLELPFSQTSHLQNPWNENKLVKIGRDGTELASAVGIKLCNMFPVDDGVDLDSLRKKVRRLQENHPYPYRSGTSQRYSEKRRSGPAGSRSSVSGGGAAAGGVGARRGSRSPPSHRQPPPSLSGSNSVRPRPGASRGGPSGGGGKWAAPPPRYSGGRDNGAYGQDFGRGGYGGGYPGSGGGGHGGSSLPSICDWSFPPPPQPLIPPSYGGGMGLPRGSDRSGRAQPPSAYSDPYRGRNRPDAAVGRRGSPGSPRRSGGGRGGGVPRRRREASRSPPSGRNPSPPVAYSNPSAAHKGGKAPAKRAETPPRYRREKERERERNDGRR